ncbi:YrhK family protein [Consotaella salsifontis]|uniref:YrhK-like protein n=1 Tax=Consotaella salsifontis TaxID=1365950 RepID=A0A1T4SR69_9HYPH|nr:YrhK family protein [Consotaella salsifontis]SKA30754.1 YrhK-like protein [Consotaella salsifontis]
MKLFKPDNPTKSSETKDIYAAYEIAYTIVDFAAAMAFLVGSILFFKDSTQTAGTWLFVIGSILFGLKPTLRIARELHYLVVGNYSALAKRFRS